MKKETNVRKCVWCGTVFLSCKPENLCTKCQKKRIKMEKEEKKHER